MDGASAFQAGDDELAVGHVEEGLDGFALEQGILEAKGEGGELGVGGGHGCLELSCLGEPVDRGMFSKGVDGAENAEDAERVGEGVAKVA